jgi:hypothetical protein
LAAMARFQSGCSSRRLAAEINRIRLAQPWGSLFRKLNQFAASYLD